MAHGDDEEARWLLPPRGEPPPRGDGQPWKLLLLFSFLVGLGLVAFDVTKYASNALSPPGEKLVLAESTVLHVEITNEYAPVKGAEFYPWLKGKAVVEPFKETTFSVRPGDFEENLTFHWAVPASEDGSTAPVAFTGHQPTMVFTATGNYNISVAATDPTGNVVASAAIFARCIYVKREIRALSIDDREKFLDAMHTIWTTSTDQGRLKYGPKFTGMDQFVAVHADQATGDLDCDHWHEGSGFLAHHLALSASFEMALGAIDERVSMPYWDFTKEGEAILKAGLGPSKLPTVSDVFTAEWFGASDELSHISDGRWAHTPAHRAAIDPATGAAVGVHNSYGFIRAPWNNANDREVVRHMSDVCGLEPVNKPIPTCKTHYAVMSQTSFPAFQLEIAGYGHGPMHVNTGGVYGGCAGAMDKLYTNYENEMKKVWTMKGISDAVLEKWGYDPGWSSEVEFNMKMLIEKYVNLEYFHIYRMLWRSQTCAADRQPLELSCPESCSLDTPTSECRCTCKGIDPVSGNTDDFDWENVEPCLYSSDTSQAIFKTVVPETLRKDIVTMFCSAGVQEGSMLASESPSDPMFFMIHPILDRMHVAKRLAKTNEGMQFGYFGPISAFEDESWLDYSFYDSNSTYCSGHGMEDAVLEDLPLPPALILAGDVNLDGALSNFEFTEALDPNVEAGTLYIFDHFDWEHCNPNDSIEEGSFATGYNGDVEAEHEIFTFSGGINPEKWSGASYASLKPEAEALAETSRVVDVKEFRAAAAAGRRPGKRLEKSNHPIYHPRKEPRKEQGGHHETQG